MNAPNWKEYNSWEEIKFLCENSNFTVRGVVYNEIKMVINKRHGRITLNIGDCRNNDISLVMNNLPENIDNLVIGITAITENKYLEKIFTNLPFTLKKIIFVYKQSKLSEMKTMQANGKFNVLFGIKIPFNCNFVVNYDGLDYNVSYNQSEDVVEIKSSSNIFKIKYRKPKLPTQNGNGGAMGGGLMQLVAYDAQDVYLTGNPQITFFRSVYRGYSNFSMGPINVDNSENKMISHTTSHDLIKIQRKDKFLESNQHTKNLFSRQNKKMKANYR